MLFIAHWLVIIVFWFFIIRLLRLDGAVLPSCFAVLWIAGYFLFPLLGIEGGLYFISYGALLTLFLIYVDLTRKHLGWRNKTADPLQAMQNEASTEDKQL